MWHTKVLLIKNGCKVVLWFSEHEEITFPHEFLSIFNPLSNPLGAIFPKNIVNSGREGGVQKKYIKERWPNGENYL